MAEHTSLQIWGNNMGVQIPQSILEKTGITMSDMLNISVVNDSIIIKKAFKHKTFEERVAEYHGEISVYDFEWKEPQGRELI